MGNAKILAICKVKIEIIACLHSFGILKVNNVKNVNLQTVVNANIIKLMDYQSVLNAPLDLKKI
jgi:hypothetical protein